MSAKPMLSQREDAEPDRLAPFSAPRDVDRVLGHDAAATEFEAALQSGRLHHAWALVGPEGIGKATLAYRLSRTVLAYTQTAGPNTAEVKDVPADHPVFRHVAGLTHPNLLVIRRSWIEKTKRYSQWIGVDEVRRLRAFLGSTAANGAWRVVVVDRADQLNQSAANALLKALEEPPPRTVFLLISSAEGRLPVTIRSRTRILRLTALDRPTLTDAVRATLVRDEVEVSEKSLELAVALAEGSVRRALELLAGEGLELYEELAEMLKALPETDGAVLHRRAERLSNPNQTERLELYVAVLLGLIERLVRFAATGTGAIEPEQDLARRLVSKDNLANWAHAWEQISQARDETFALNLDRNLFVLNAWFHLKQLVNDHPVH